MPLTEREREQRRIDEDPDDELERRIERWADDMRPERPETWILLGGS